MDLPHKINIILHVTTALTALAIGLVLLARPKGDRAHRRWGGVVLALFWTAVATAALGVILFRPAPTLAAVTLLSAYLLISGWRVIRTRGAGAGLPDTLLALIAVAAGGVFVSYILRGGPGFWQPQATLPIAGSLIFWGGYDLVRLAFPRDWTSRIWRLEHGVKLTVALSGLASAGAGTVLPQYAPWSQVGPSIVATLYIVLYLALRGRRHLAPAPPA